MRLGKITRTAWQRSVRRQLHRGCAALFACLRENCSGYRRKMEPVVWADAHTAGDSGRTGFMRFFRQRELAAKGVRPQEVSILFPGERKKKLRKWQQGLKKPAAHGYAGSASRGSYSGSGTYCCMCHAAGTAAGILRKTVCRTISGNLLCGYAGLEGTLRILDEAEEELSSRFVSAFLDQTKELKNELVTPEQLLSCETERILAARQIGSGGILAALWELAEDVDAGFEIDMANIALKQETVEICEFYRLNPYQMTSAGSFLIVTTEAEQVIELLKGAGARAGRLGVTKAQNARVITSGEEIRYLDRPRRMSW